MATGTRFGKRAAILAAILLLACCAFAQQASEHLSGTWTATVGPSETLRGTWTAETNPRDPNFAHGTWTLLSAEGTVVAGGTWSARKTGSEWSGTWAAGTPRGGHLSGSWRAAISDTNVRTFAGLLKSAIKKYVSGDWRSGRYSGNWWLQGSADGAGQ